MKCPAMRRFGDEPGLPPQQLAGGARDQSILRYRRGDVLRRSSGYTEDRERRLGCWSEVMLRDIVEVRPLGGYRLYLRFEDGIAGELDFAGRLRFEEVFAPLRDPTVFAQVRIHPELGTVVWPNWADLDPDVLYAELSGTPIVVPPAPTRRTR